MLIHGMVCLYTGWGVSIRDGVLVHGMGYYSTGWGISIQDGVLVYGINGIVC